MLYHLLFHGFKRRLSKNETTVVTQHVNRLKSNKEIIELEDFGAKSKVTKRTSRSIKELYATSASKGRYGLLLFQLQRQYQGAKVLELGSNLGMGTLFLHLGNPQALLTSVEGDPKLCVRCKSNFNTLNISSVHFENKRFDVFLEQNSTIFDVIFVDGHHDGNALLNYMRQLDKFSHDETLFILDDIRWSKGMLSAWKTLVNSEDYHVSVDLFRMGLLWKRKHQAKEHFTIRIPLLFLHLLRK